MRVSVSPRIALFLGVWPMVFISKQGDDKGSMEAKALQGNVVNVMKEKHVEDTSPCL